MDAVENPEHEFDDTDMTPEEFEERIAAGIPADVYASKAEHHQAMTLPAHFVEVTTNQAGVVNREPLVVVVGGQVAHWVSKDRTTANAE